MLRSVYCLLATGLLGQPTGPIFKGQAGLMVSELPFYAMLSPKDSQISLNS